MRTNTRQMVYTPRRVRSKAPQDFGRVTVIWSVRIGGQRHQVGQTGDLLAHGRDRRFNWLTKTGGDFVPNRQFRYWPTNLEI